MTKSILLAGFGGQGILFAGKFLAYKGLIEGMEVSWLPSYGPEMRGGTCNCSVILSDKKIGSPIIANPDVLVAMNLPSLDKFENDVVPGGQIYVDSTLIERKVTRTDVDVFYIPATKMASDGGFRTLANMIIMGNVIKNCDGICHENIDKAMGKVVSAKHQDLLQVNVDAVEMGYNF